VVRQSVRVVGSCVWLLLAAGTLNGNEALSMRVSPAVAFAPGFLTVTVSVQADADNRSLQIVAESPDFYRSSQIPLDGQNAPRLSRFEFGNLPTGLYQVSGVLIGTNGPRAVTQRLAKVEPAAGGR
jgi:hypothetical protein